MGSGKSHCGKKISVHLGVPFIDLDEEIEKAENKSISTLFLDEGENVFRKKEADTLRAIVKKYAVDGQQVSAVISCGGGTPCFHENAVFMNKHGLTVWLNPSVKILVDRLKKGQHHRPLIADLSEVELEDFVMDKLKERALFYEQAILHIDSNDCSIDLIEKKLNNE